MRKGFTLVEVLIAVSLFTLAAVIASNILIDVVKLDKKTAIETAIYEDLRVILQQLTNEIQRGGIDYEEYYNQQVVQARGTTNAQGGPFYGINYGVYGSRFYHPGESLSGVATNPADLGIECSYPNPLPDGGDCEIYYTRSADLNTGENPFENGASDPDDASAFCDSSLAVGPCPGDNEVEELYLIDSTGTKKTIFGRKRLTTNDWSIGIVRMEGRDLDQNGMVDVFTCFEEFTCVTNAPPGIQLYNAIKYPDIQALVEQQSGEYTLAVPQKEDLNRVFDINTSHFIPISPMRASLKDLRFIINPVEDPYKAFGEADVQSHPSVTIILTLGLSTAAAAEYPGGAGAFDDITVQTTVAAGVLGGIDSYPPVNDLHDPDGSWIQNVF